VKLCFKNQKRIHKCGHGDFCEPFSERKIKTSKRTKVAAFTPKRRRAAKEALFEPSTAKSFLKNFKSKIIGSDDYCDGLG